MRQHPLKMTVAQAERFFYIRIDLPPPPLQVGLSVQPLAAAPDAHRTRTRAEARAQAAARPAASRAATAAAAAGTGGNASAPRLAPPQG